MKRILQLLAALSGVAGLICIALFFFKGGGGGKLAWEDPIVRKSLMTFGYKIYGDPAVENGRLFLSKIVFHNAGVGPVHDLSVSYQVPDYISWTTPQTQPEVPAGQTLVALYYPELPSKVTSLTNDTNATLETKIHWSDRQGQPKEEILRSKIILRGVNELDYCDLPESEVATFADQHSTGEFCIAMVTPNDPVVKQFVAEVTKRTGGTLAGFTGGKELAETMKAMYDYMCETGMRYTSSEGVPAKVGDVSTLLQTVRMPRDVIITNQGLCIELAILWASAMEYLGCDADIVFIQGHAFVIVSAGQTEIPIECTAITPKSVQGWLKPLGLDENASVIPFEKAVQLSQMELVNIQRNNEPFIVYGVKAYQGKGMLAPELPAVDIEKIQNMLAQRSQHTAASYAQNVGRPSGPAVAPDGASSAAAGNPVRPGYFRWAGVNNSASVDVPAGWTRMENGPLPGEVFVAQDQMTGVGVNVFHYANLASPVEAMQFAKQSIGRIGGSIRIASQQRKGNMIIYTGTTSFRRQPTREWAGFFSPAQAGVIGMFVGTNKGYFQTYQPLIQDVISSFRIGNGGGNNSNTQEDGN